MNRSPDPALAADPDPQDGGRGHPVQDDHAVHRPPRLASRRCGSATGTGCGPARWTWPAIASRRTHTQADQFAIPAARRHDAVPPIRAGEPAGPGRAGAPGSWRVACRAGDPQLEQRPVAGRRCRRPRPTSGTSHRPGPPCCSSSTTACSMTAPGHLRGDAAVYDLIVEQGPRPLRQSRQHATRARRTAHRAVFPRSAGPRRRLRRPAARRAGHARQLRDSLARPSAVPHPARRRYGRAGLGRPGARTDRFARQGGNRDRPARLLCRPSGPGNSRRVGLGPRVLRAGADGRARAGRCRLRPGERGRRAGRAHAADPRRRQRDDHAAAVHVAGARGRSSRSGGPRGHGCRSCTIPRHPWRSRRPRTSSGRSPPGATSARTRSSCSAP